MKDTLKSMLSLSSQERKGALLLIILIFLITAANVWLKTHPPKGNEAETTRLYQELEAFEQQLTLRDDSLAMPTKSGNSEPGDFKEMFPFDPNRVTAGEMGKLGLDDKLIRILINYRKHGGRFYEKEDMKKVYGLSANQYERLSPYIVIATSPDAGKKPFRNMVITNETVDLNRADAAKLEELPGIGPVLSNRIIRYRSLLGGFYNTRQLSEVYGMADSVVAMLQQRVHADTTALVRMNLNEARENELARHPYIGKFTARGIVSYRSQVTRINDPAELKKNGLISEEDFEKVRMYLEL